jgi:carbamoyltransferase
MLRDGVLVAAAQEERFSRIKYDHRFPRMAVDYCLRESRIRAGEVDYAVFYEKPFPKFERIFQSVLTSSPRSWGLFREAMMSWLREKLWIKSEILASIPIPSNRILFVDHHMSHAASAIFCSPFEEAAVLTVDGVGEWSTCCVGRASSSWSDGSRNMISLEEEICFPHSLGLLYSTFTAWLGFKVNSGEYKVMGMAPYGQPRYIDKLLKVARCNEDGSIWLDMDYFGFHHSAVTSYSGKFIELFGPPRPPEKPFSTEAEEGGGKIGEKEIKENRYYADVAATVQQFTEETLLRMARYLKKKTGLDNLVMAGGVALNSSANGRIMRESPFKNVFIQPNPGDAGGALGAALYAWHILMGRPRSFVMEHAYHGESFSDEAVDKFLREGGARHEYFEDQEKLAVFLADAVLRQKVVGISRGRFEWGPRALGNRSILADPRRGEMKENVNTKIKFREPFRPFAPAVLEKESDRFFEMGAGENQYPQRFMLSVFPVRKERGADIQAVNHFGTARLQVVRREWNPLYYEVIRLFGEETGVPLLLNTSFNLRGEPMVCSPADAMRTFRASDIDLMILNNHVVSKS